MRNILGFSVTQDPDLFLALSLNVEGRVVNSFLYPEIRKEHGSEKNIFSFKNLSSKEKSGILTEMRLFSRASRPSDAEGPFINDRRKLGVLISEVKLLLKTGEEIVIDRWRTQKILSGWNNLEKEPVRWTSGRALIPMPPGVFNACRAISISVTAKAFYLLEANIFR